MNKYRYIHVLQACFGQYGWEDIDETEDKSQIPYLRKEYRMAYKGPVRVIKRRVLNS